MRAPAGSLGTYSLPPTLPTQDPKTQLELLEYAKEGCSVFADFKDQCEQYVTLYGPLVFNMLISYLQPDALCTRLGYCTPQPSLVVT